jgi:hypothetical protein
MDPEAFEAGELELPPESVAADAELEDASAPEVGSASPAASAP